MRNPRQPLLDGEVYRKLAVLLKPGDIILTRTDGYLSTWMVPGFLTHAGMFIGERNGRQELVSEAIGEGVRLVDLIDFLREDYAVVVRVKDGCTGTIYANLHEYAVERALEQVDKKIEYDHVFDFIDARRVCCTEHICINYPTKRWGKMRFGRFSVVADDIYQCAKDNPDEFEIIYDSRCDNAAV